MKADRRSDRIKRRVTCELLLDGRRYRGIVLDLSETGVFVQTEATPAPGASVRLRFHAPDGAAFEVDASVARRQVAPPQLASVVRGGLGLRVSAPPPGYFALLGQDTEQAESSARSRARDRRPAARTSAAGAKADAAHGTASACPASPTRASVGTATTPPAAPRSAPRASGPPPRVAPRAPAPPPPGSPFRVRVKQTDGPRSRTLDVRAASPDDAAKRALADLGRGWEVLKVERG